MENVGAAATVVAANTPSKARRDMSVVLEVMFLRVSRRLPAKPPFFAAYNVLPHPQMHALYATTRLTDQAPMPLLLLVATVLSGLLRIYR